jgi:hypothetical protein
VTVRSGGFAPAPAAGTPGRSIVSAAIGSGGHLFVTYSDGSIMDAGAMPGVDITVGDGPPSTVADPGDLYLDALSGDFYRMEN